MTSVELNSHLSYADRNAFMDSARKVLACPADDCTEQAPWIDAKDAVLKGWAFEDRVVDGSVVRHWFCPAHKPADNAPVLLPRAIIRTITNGGLSMKELRKLRFDEARLTLVRLGENAGTQIAVVLCAGRSDWRVVGWKASSSRWIGPKSVPPEKILGEPQPKDRRLIAMAKAWPP
jgi:hypothetical protein